MKWLLLYLIRGYQIIVSPLFPAACRFQPTCSQYGIEALKVHGAAKGSYLLIKRIIKCNPFVKSGYDPVPPKKE